MTSVVGVSGIVDEDSAKFFAYKKRRPRWDDFMRLERFAGCGEFMSAPCKMLDAVRERKRA